VSERTGDEKGRWVQHYADRLLQQWRRSDSPFGVAPEYLQHIERDLSRRYDQPLMRVFIEKTY